MNEYHGFTRDIDLRQAGRERQAIEFALESGDPGAITDEVRAAVERYNRDDVRSTWQLQRWLEARREEAIARGDDVPRPQPSSGEAPEEKSGSASSSERTTPEAAGRRDVRMAPRPRYLTAYLLDWHRHENKAEWWNSSVLSA